VRSGIAVRCAELSYGRENYSPYREGREEKARKKKKKMGRNREIPPAVLCYQPAIAPFIGRTATVKNDSLLLTINIRKEGEKKEKGWTAVFRRFGMGWVRLR